MTKKITEYASKDYIKYNTNCDNVYPNGYIDLLDYSISVNKSFKPVDESVFDFSIPNYSNNPNLTVYIKNIKLNKTYDSFTDPLSLIKYSFVFSNSLVSEQSVIDNVKNPPYSTLKLIILPNKIGTITFIIHYGKKITNENNKIISTNDNNYIAIRLGCSVDLSKITEDMDFSGTINCKLSLNEYNSDVMLQFPLLKPNKYGDGITLATNTNTTGSNSINFTNSTCSSNSLILGNNNIPSANTCASIIGDHNSFSQDIWNSIIIGSYNSVAAKTNLANGGIFVHGNNIKYSENNTRPNNKGQGTFLFGVGLNASSNGFLFGQYGTLAEDKMFALANGSSTSNEKLIFTISKEGLAETEAIPSTDNSLINKKYADENYISKKPNEFVITKNGSAVTVDLTTNTYNNYSSVYVNGEFVSNDSITINCPVPSDNTFNEMHIFFIIKPGETFNNIIFNSNTKYTNLANMESKSNNQLVEVILKKVYNFYTAESKVYLGPLITPN